MNKSYGLMIFLGLFVSFKILGQENYKLKDPGKKYYSRCEECLELIKSRPKEIEYHVFLRNNDHLYFYVSNKEWFYKMFDDRGDGIAVDIISRSVYECGKYYYEKRNSWVKGKLLKPVFKKELEQNIVYEQNNEIVIDLGVVSTEYTKKDYEFNLLFIQNNNFCYYRIFSNLQSYRWDLLDMGFYFDTLSNKSLLEKGMSEQEEYILHHKVLQFEIPFEKNASAFSKEDIKPLYDSLNLTDFTIQKISIRAYSSIEGDDERNRELQEERAGSIVAALQSYQKPSIITDIMVSENWVDFLNDILLTEYSYLSDLSKAEIKQELKDRELERKLEPYLKKHRKAIIVLNLQKKDKYKNLSGSVLIDLFSKSISDKNLEEAIEIQNSVFEKVRLHELPTGFIDKLEIPAKSEFSLLLNKRSIFKYLMNESDVFIAYDELKELENMIPNDGHLKYNICALRFKIWLLGESAFLPKDFKKEIMELEKFGIHGNLIKRMLINYNILMCEYYMRDSDYDGKTRCINYIYSNYKNLPMSDQDYLSLAQFLASYRETELAINLLRNKVKTVDVDEDLLFYYINLTIIDDDMVSSSDYRTILLNAFNINPQRFCQIFNSNRDGGVSFQLLRNTYLRDSFCENCH